MDFIAPITGLLSKYIPDKDQAAQLAHDLSTLTQKLAHEAIKGQLEINKTEASHKSLFVAGWRPAVGWVCCLGMAGNFLIIPFFNFGLALADSTITIPLINLSDMMPVLTGMLGLGAMRTYEKIKRVERNQ